MTPRAIEAPATATAAQGFVILEHEAGLAVTLTKEAATRTGERLIAAAAEAAQQPVATEEDGPAGTPD